MLIAVFDTAGDVQLVDPAAIRSIILRRRGSVVVLRDGRQIAGPEAPAVIYRRIRAHVVRTPGRSRVLRRLWVGEQWRRVRLGAERVLRQLRRVTQRRRTTAASSSTAGC